MIRVFTHYLAMILTERFTSFGIDRIQHRIIKGRLAIRCDVEEGRCKLNERLL